MGMTTKSMQERCGVALITPETQIPQKVFIVKIKGIFAFHVASTLYTNVQ